MPARLQTLLAPRNEHRILGLMLLLLHAALWWEFGGALSRSLMLAHLGLFLIWQPLWSRELRLAWGSSAVFILATMGFVLWLNWWLMTFWLLLLTGLVGGRVIVSRSDRYAYMLTLVFLVCELLVGTVPRTFEVAALPPEMDAAFGEGLLALPAALLLFPAHVGPEKQAHALDFLYGIAVAMLAAILALGSLLGMYHMGVPYTVALFESVLGIALFLLAISWLWMPRAGFSGLGQLLERYLLNIGTPFESWLGRLATLSRRRQSPDTLLAAAMKQFVELPWVAGVEWSSDRHRGADGQKTAHAFDVRAGDLEVTVYANRPVGAALLMHGKLLIQLLGHFHRAKQREQELTQRAHMQAVYETGARVTHDIKNLLQSLHTITMAVQDSGAARQAELQTLLARQLPHLTQRLQLALDKLQAPAEASTEECPLAEWWESLQARNAQDQIRFESRLTANPRIPVDLFDSVADNLLENARIKRQSEPGLEISVRLETADGRLRLQVRDNGSPVESAIAEELFRGPVRSRNGLGIGLYQAARLAAQMGYTLTLDREQRGEVCFELVGRHKPALAHSA